MAMSVVNSTDGCPDEQEIEYYYDSSALQESDPLAFSVKSEQIENICVVIKKEQPPADDRVEDTVKETKRYKVVVGGRLISSVAKPTKVENVRENSKQVTLGTGNNHLQYHCDLCNVTLFDKRNYNRHMNIGIHKSAYECEPCKLLFHTTEDCKIHKSICNSVKNIVNNAIIVKNNLNIIKCAEKIKETPCSESSKGKIIETTDLTLNESLNDSIMIDGDGGGGNTNSKSEQFVCYKCNRSFLKKRDLAIHMTRVHMSDEDKRFKCKLCSKSFKYKNSLTKHDRLFHKRLKPFSCKYCNKKFSTSYNLKEHLQVHEDVERYKCDVCSETFRNFGQFKFHCNIHVPKIT